ncbi:MAG: endoribonuclease YicC domain-containing protein [Spirochaetota bacterium]
MESMTGYGESHFSVEGVQLVCSARSVNSRFLDVELHYPPELSWFKSHTEEIIRSRFSRGRIEVAFTSSAPLPVDIAFNTDIIAQYERFLAQQTGKKKVNLDPRDFLQLPGFMEKRVKNWRSYQNKFDFHLLRALIKMQRARLAEGKRTTRVCLTHLRYLARIQRRIGVLHTQAHKKKQIGLRHRIYADLISFPADPSRGEKEKVRGERKLAMQAAQLIWHERRDELLRLVHNDASEEISRIGMHIARMLEIFLRKESAGRELEFFLQELQRETNTIASKAQDSEINSLTVVMKTEIEKLREQVRNLE